MLEQEVIGSYEGRQSVGDGLSHVLSWGGALAGVFVTLAIQLLLNLLGIGIGASSIDAAQGNQPGQGMAIGALIWFVLSWVLSLAMGAWTAAQFSRFRSKRVGALHGLLVWAIASISLVYILSTAAGSLVGGTASVLGRTASLIGSGAKSSAPAMASMVSQATGVTPKDISDQAGDLASDPKFQKVLTDALQNGEFSQQDRESLVNLLVERRHMTPADANQTLDTWQSDIQNGARSAKETALKVEDKAATGVSAAGFGSFFSLLLGLVAAIVGGTLGITRKGRVTTSRAEANL